jgi:hypothetical protein
MRDRRRERLMRVAVADNLFTAEFLRGRLKEAGVPCSMRNREGGAAVVGGIGGTFELFVLEGDVDLAAAVLGDGTPPEALPQPSLPTGRPRSRRRRWWQ